MLAKVKWPPAQLGGEQHHRGVGREEGRVDGFCEGMITPQLAVRALWKCLAAEEGIGLVHGAQKGRASPVLSEELVAQHFGVGGCVISRWGWPLQVLGCAGGLCALGTPSLCWMMHWGL